MALTKIEDEGERFENPIFIFKKDRSFEWSVEINGRRKTVKGGLFIINQGTINLSLDSGNTESIAFTFSGEDLNLNLDGEWLSFKRVK